jgi:hypothetical protein
MNAHEINKAIAAHGTWKVRLHDAIESGTSDFKPEIVSLDNACDFGKWLYSIPLAERPRDFWDTVQELHARFHKEAAKVLRLAVGKKPQEALALMSDLKGDFVTSSIQLTQTLNEWKKVSV